MATFFYATSCNLDGIGSIPLNSETGIEFNEATQIAEVTTGHKDGSFYSVVKYKPVAGMLSIPVLQNTIDTKNVIKKINAIQNKGLEITGVVSFNDGSQLRFSGGLTEVVKVNTGAKDTKINIQGILKLV